MIRNTLTSIAFAAGCAIALAAPAAQAQATDTWVLTTAPRLMDRNETYLQYRMQRECGSIANSHLRTGCMDSLSLSEDLRSRGLSDGLTGDSDGRMNSIDRTFQGPERYDPHLGR
jgi:hypothetical protein